jgi:hypothetical protein
MVIERITLVGMVSPKSKSARGLQSYENWETGVIAAFLNPHKPEGRRGGIASGVY